MFVSERICFYCTCIRPAVEYTSPIFHYAIPNYLCKHIEQIQRRAIRIVFPTKSDAEALFHSKLLSFRERPQRACGKQFKEIMEDPNHKLHQLLPQPNKDAAYSLTPWRTFKKPKYKTDRFKNTFIFDARHSKHSIISSYLALNTRHFGEIRRFSLATRANKLRAGCAKLNSFNKSLLPVYFTIMKSFCALDSTALSQH